MSGYKGAADVNINLLVLAALVKRLGGRVVITQAEVDAVAFSTLHDHMRVDPATGAWGMELTLRDRKVSG